MSDTPVFPSNEPRSIDATTANRPPKPTPPMRHREDDAITLGNPPMPEAPPPEGKQWSFVKAYFDNKQKKHVNAHWRLIPVKREGKRDPISHRASTKPRKAKPRGPVPGKPRMTSPAHATYVRDKLAVPLTFFVTLKNMEPHQGTEIQNLLYECIQTIHTARLFIGRFTTDQPMDE